MSQTNGRYHVATIVIHSVRELRELQAAANERTANLEKLAKKAGESFLKEEAAIMRGRLRLWEGEDGEPGILERIADQMHLYEPAFSSNGKEPEGQQDIFDGTERQPEPEPETVPLGAFKAALILSQFAADVGDEAFDKLDEKPDAENPLRIAYLGRAPIELLEKMPREDALELFTAALETIDKIPAAAFDPENEKRVQEIADRLATAIASTHGALAPYYEPFPVAGEPEEPTPEIDYATADRIAEDGWRTLTENELNAIIDHAVEASAEDQEPAQAEDEIGKEQENVLIHAAASSDEFKFVVANASRAACERALEIVQGLSGNQGREKAIRKRLLEIELTEAPSDESDPVAEVLRETSSDGAETPEPVGSAT